MQHAGHSSSRNKEGVRYAVGKGVRRRGYARSCRKSGAVQQRSRCSSGRNRSVVGRYKRTGNRNIRAQERSESFTRTNGVRVIPAACRRRQYHESRKCSRARVAACTNVCPCRHRHLRPTNAHPRLRRRCAAGSKFAQVRAHAWKVLKTATNHK